MVVGMRKLLVQYWWVWLLLVVVGAAANELFDGAVGGGSHPVADVLIGVLLALVACYGTSVVMRRRHA